MKASELRIGNWVHSGITKEDFIIEAHDIVNISGGFDNGKVQPIPLTKEWLLKFGLKYLQNACWELGSMRIYNLSDETTSRFRITLAGHELVIINYVHQLQNLYFALTGEELKIKQQ
jgi:hypothetical protein